MNSDEIAKKTGESLGPVETPEVSLNGETGRFTIFDRSIGKDPETGKFKPQQLDAGVQLRFDPETGDKIVVGEPKPLKVVFLKKRRMLSFYHPDGVSSLRTAEHNHKYERTILYGPERNKEAGIADVLRQKYPDLRTVEKVYCYFPELKKVVRLVVKGSSLGSKVQDDKILKFYDYLQTYKKPEHFWQYVTEIVPVPEKGPKGTYFAMSFTRGAQLEQAELEKVINLINEVHEEKVKEDAAVAQRMSTMETVEPVADGSDKDFEEGTQVQYPDDEVNPEDIPF